MASEDMNKFLKKIGLYFQDRLELKTCLQKKNKEVGVFGAPYPMFQ